MKIALYSRGTEGGGIGINASQLGRYLQGAGHDVVRVVHNVHNLEIESPASDEQHLPHVLLPKPGRWESNVGYTRRLADHFAAARYDIVFVNIGTDLWPILAGLHWWPDATTIVLVLQNTAERIYASARVNLGAWNVAVAISPGVQSGATAHLPGKPIVTIRHGIDLPTEARVAARLAWATPLRLLYAGRLKDEQKGILRLPEILAGCKQQGLPVQMTVIGRGADKAKLELGFDQQGVADLVDMRDWQPVKVVYEAMQTHHVLLMPSNYEGFGLVSVEAQANGCVPVASLLTDVTDMTIADGVSGYVVETADIGAYVAAIGRLLDAERWQAFSQAGIERSRRLFSVDAMGRNYLDLIEQIAAGKYALAGRRSQSSGQYSFARRDYLPKFLRRWPGRFRRLISRLTTS